MLIGSIHMLVEHLFSTTWSVPLAVDAGRLMAKGVRAAGARGERTGFDGVRRWSRRPRTWTSDCLVFGTL